MDANQYQGITKENRHTPFLALACIAFSLLCLSALARLRIQKYGVGYSAGIIQCVGIIQCRDYTVVD